MIKFEYALALAGSLALALFHAFTVPLHHLPDRHKSMFASLSGGAGLAYVSLYLLYELVHDGASKIHALFPVGPGSLETLFILLLTSLATVYVVQTQLERTANQRDDHHGYAALFLIYNLMVGVGLLDEARWGALNLAFYTLALGLHLLANDLFLLHSFPRQHTWRWRLALAASPTIGCLAGGELALPPGVIYAMLTVVTASTLINVLRRELPDTKAMRPLSFLTGTVIYAVLVFATWRF